MQIVHNNIRISSSAFEQTAHPEVSPFKKTDFWDLKIAYYTAEGHYICKLRRLKTVF